jgi:hypothetical protein
MLSVPQDRFYEFVIVSLAVDSLPSLGTQNSQKEDETSSEYDCFKSTLNSFFSEKIIHNNRGTYAADSHSHIATSYGGD